MVTSGTEKAKPKRRYTSALRKQHERITHELIMRALADILTVDGVYDFSIQQVADRAGLSYQSVYRHFPSREALLATLCDWLDETEALLRTLSGEMASFGNDIPGMVPKMFGWCDEHAAMVRAATIVALKMNTRSNTSQTIDDRFRQIVAGVTSNLDPKEGRRAFAAIRYLASPYAWLILTQRFELDKEEAAETASWATKTLLDDLKRRNAKAARTQPGNGNAQQI